ncbi:hypothetical protein [Bombella pollinis]|uniref:Uncharacterized protein n=1 Tax=Bombella pollinis TaxID=2967337 RepID=A0ABT3WLC3_9PROT|nr:hypothetical protein [Bombella pollinis]MCX5619917.1 hypothetical protein [Bombella pollinis]
MNDSLKTDLRDLHQRIRDAVASRFPAFKVVEFYRDEESEDLPTPACLLELEEMEYHEEDLGTDQIMVSLRFSARLVFSREGGPDGLLNVRLAASDVAAFINKNRFGGRVFPARVLSCGTDFFRPDLTDRYAIWRVEWHHEQAIFGVNSWDQADAAGPSPKSIIVNGEQINAS